MVLFKQNESSGSTLRVFVVFGRVFRLQLDQIRFGSQSTQRRRTIQTNSSDGQKSSGSCKYHYITTATELVATIDLNKLSNIKSKDEDMRGAVAFQMLTLNWGSPSSF